MQDLRGKTAVITGGASGIGLGMAEALGREGMNIVLADIEAAALAAAVEDLESKQIRVLGVEADVTSRQSVRAAAQAAIARFGQVHVVCNNAGVFVAGPMEAIVEHDWDWVFDVNVKGVIHGMEVFRPLIEEHGEGGHFVNTASLGGLIAGPGGEPYCGAKFAVVAMSEGWAAQLAPRNIGVSILCPGLVDTKIFESGRNRPQAYGGPPAAGGEPVGGELADLQTLGMSPAAVGARVVEGIRDNDLYIFTHPNARPTVEARFARILAGFDKSAGSPAIVGQPQFSATGGARKDGDG